MQDGIVCLMKEIPSPEPEFYIPMVRKFSYNPETQTFEVGNEEAMLNFPLTDTEDIFDLQQESFVLGRDVKSLDEHILGIGAGMRSPIIAFPPLRRWIMKMTDTQRRAIGEQVKDAMHEAIQAFRTPSSRWERSSTAYVAELRPDGEFRLQTPGVCACLGVHLSDRNMFMVGSRSIDSLLPQAYTLHNADGSGQRLSLYAGAGTLAWLMQNAQEG